MDLISTILQTCKTVDYDRDENVVFRHVVEEVGELSEELTIALGHSYKQPGKDGVIGESIDAIISLVDMIYVHAQRNNIPMSQEIMVELAKPKLAKWEQKVNEINNKG